MWPWVNSWDTDNPVIKSGTVATLLIKDVKLVWDMSDMVAEASVTIQEFSDRTSATPHTAGPTLLNNATISTRPMMPAGTTTTTSSRTPTSLTASTTLPANPHRSGQSSSMIAGVAVGSVAGLIILLSAAISLYRRMRAPQTQRTDQSSDLVGFFARVKRRSKQVDPTTLHEIEGKARPAEVDGMNVRAELEGDWRGNELEEK